MFIQLITIVTIFNKPRKQNGNRIDFDFEFQTNQPIYQSVSNSSAGNLKKIEWIQFGGEIVGLRENVFF